MIERLTETRCGYSSGSIIISLFLRFRLLLIFHTQTLFLSHSRVDASEWKKIVVRTWKLSLWYFTRRRTRCLTLLSYDSFINDVDDMGILECTQSMGDHYRRSTDRCFVQSFLQISHLIKFRRIEQPALSFQNVHQEHSLLHQESEWTDPWRLLVRLQFVVSVLQKGK